MENKRPEFYFPDDGTPEKVDWLGQKTQIDAALAAGRTGIERETRDARHHDHHSLSLSLSFSGARRRLPFSPISLSLSVPRLSFSEPVSFTPCICGRL